MGTLDHVMHVEHVEHMGVSAQAMPDSCRCRLYSCHLQRGEEEPQIQRARASLTASIRHARGRRHGSDESGNIIGPAHHSTSCSQSNPFLVRQSGLFHGHFYCHAIAIKGHSCYFEPACVWCQRAPACSSTYAQARALAFLHDSAASPFSPQLYAAVLLSPLLHVRQPETGPTHAGTYQSYQIPAYQCHHIQPWFLAMLPVALSFQVANSSGQPLLHTAPARPLVLSCRLGPVIIQPLPV